MRRNLEELKQIISVIEESENKIKLTYATDEKSEVDGDVRKARKELRKENIELKNVIKRGIRL